MEVLIVVSQTKTFVKSHILALWFGIFQLFWWPFLGFLAFGLRWADFDQIFDVPLIGGLARCIYGSNIISDIIGVQQFQRGHIDLAVVIVAKTMVCLATVDFVGNIHNAVWLACVGRFELLKSDDLILL